MQENFQVHSSISKMFQLNSDETLQAIFTIKLRIFIEHSSFRLFGEDLIDRNQLLIIVMFHHYQLLKIIVTEHLYSSLQCKQTLKRLSLHNGYTAQDRVRQIEDLFPLCYRGHSIAGLAAIESSTFLTIPQ